jgi:hypothetical protein
MTDLKDPKDTYTVDDIKKAKDSVRSDLSRQISEERQGRKALEDELAALRAESESRQKKELEDAQNFKALAEKAEKDRETAVSKLSKELAEARSEASSLRFDMEMSRHNVKDPLKVEGLKAMYSKAEKPGTPSEWLTTMKETQPDIFKGLDSNPNLQDKAAGTPSQGGSQMTDEVAIQYQESGDPEKMLEAENYFYEKFAGGQG